MRILLVEDDPALNRLLQKRLTEEGYGVDACLTGNDGLAFAQSAEYDAVVLDIMLPGVDGLTILRTLRKENNTTGILLLTAKDSVEDRVKGLDAGADDYLVKPFAYEELSARLRLVMRHTAAAMPSRMRLGDLTVDTSTHEVARAGRPISLTTKEYALLEYMLYNAGYVLTRMQILEHVWSNNYGVESNIVDVYVRYLRNKVDKGCENRLLHTVRGYGYMLKAGDA